MRKLKLQVQISADGYIGGPKGELDWMVWDWSDDIKRYVDDLTDSVDTILLGRKMTPGFVNYWVDATKKPESEEYDFAGKMVDYKKYVFSRTLDKSEWINTELVKGDLSDEVNKIKKQNGRDIIVYGGAEFVSNLINEDLIDEYYLFVNPVAVNKGLPIFRSDKPFKMELKESKPFDCGIIINKYIHSKING